MKRVFGNRSRDSPNTGTDVNSTTRESDCITGTYKDDFDIQAVHIKILSKFQQIQDQLPIKQAELQRLQWIRQNSTSVAERKLAAFEIKNLEDWIAKIINRVDEKAYDRRATPLLDEYQQLAITKKGRTFGVKKLVDDNSEQREIVILKYLSIARQYIDLNVVRDTRSEPCCAVCNNPLPEGSGSCANCPAFVEDFEIESSFKDNDRNNAPSRNNYGKSDHIRDAFIKFQGKQPNKLPPEMIEDLTGTITGYKISIDALGIDTLFQILKDKKYSAYYDDIYLIFHVITHKPLPDLDDIQAELFQDSDLFTSIYHEVKPVGRSNCLNAHFLRDVFLRRRGRLYPEWQCTSLRTDDVNVKHNETMKRAFERLAWGTYKPL